MRMLAEALIVHPKAGLGHLGHRYLTAEPDLESSLLCLHLAPLPSTLSSA